MQGDQYQTTTTQHRRQREDKYVRGEPQLVSEKRLTTNGQQAPIQADVTARTENPVMGYRQIGKNFEVVVERAKIVEVSVEYPVEILVEVPKEQYITRDIVIEKIVEVPVQRIREVEVETVYEHQVEMIVENPVYYERVVENKIKTQVMQEKEVFVVNKIPRYVTVDKDIARKMIQPVETVVIQKPVYKKVPVYQNREVEVPIYTHVDRVVDVAVDIEVDEYVVKHVDKHIPRDRVVDKLVHKDVDKIVEVPIDRIVEVRYEVLVTRDGRKLDTRELRGGSSRPGSTTVSRSQSHNILPRAPGTQQLTYAPQTGLPAIGQQGSISTTSHSVPQINNAGTLPHSSYDANLQGSTLLRSKYSTGNLLLSPQAPAPAASTLPSQGQTSYSSQQYTSVQQGGTIRYSGQNLPASGAGRPQTVQPAIQYQSGTTIAQPPAYSQPATQYQTAPATVRSENYSTLHGGNNGTTYYSGTQGVQGRTAIDQPSQPPQTYTTGTRLADQGQAINSTGAGVTNLTGSRTQPQQQTTINNPQQISQTTYSGTQVIGGSSHANQSISGQNRQPGNLTQYNQTGKNTQYIGNSVGLNNPPVGDSQQQHTYQSTSRNLLPTSGNVVPSTYNTYSQQPAQSGSNQIQGSTYNTTASGTTYTQGQTQGNQGTIYTQPAGQPQYQTTTHTYQPVADTTRPSKDLGGSYRETNDTGRPTQSPSRYDTHQPQVQYQPREPAQYHTTGPHEYSLLENLNRNLFHEPTPQQSQYQGAGGSQSSSAQVTPYLTPRGVGINIREIPSSQGRFQNYHPNMSTIDEENSHKGSSVVKHHEIPSPFDGEANRGSTPSQQYASRDGSVNYQLYPEADNNRNLVAPQVENRTVITPGAQQTQYTTGGANRIEQGSHTTTNYTQQPTTHYTYQPQTTPSTNIQNQTTIISGSNAGQIQQTNSQQGATRYTDQSHPERPSPQTGTTNYSTNQPGNVTGTQIQTNIGDVKIGKREVIGETTGPVPEGTLPTDRIVHYYVDKVVPKYVEEIIEKYIDVPVIKEVEVPFEVIVEKIINNDKVIETEVEVTRIVEGPAIEKIVDREIEIIREIEKPIYVDKKVIKEKEVVVEKIVEVPEEKFIEIQVEKYVDFEVEISIQRNKPVFVDKEVELTTTRRRRTSHVNENLRHSLHQSVERINQVSKENADLKSKINILRERSNSASSTRQGRHSISENKREHYENLKGQLNSIKQRINSFKNNQERTRARNSIDEHTGYSSAGPVARITSSQRIMDTDLERRESAQRISQTGAEVQDTRQYSFTQIEGENLNKNVREQ